MSKDLLLDLSFLTEAERDLINNVISKDAQIRKAEQGRISSLRKELDDLKESGLPEEELESKNEKYCARCQTYFGLIFNRGDYCPRCELRVCKVCRVNDIDEGWICTLCDKVRQVKAQSGAWFFQGHKEKNGSLFGSMLVRQSLRRLPGSQSKGIKHEPSNPFIEDEEPSNAFLEDQDVTNPFTSVNHGRSTERLSGQADRNSKESQRNSGHKMGFQYSDESDSEHRSDDESLEDHHDTASDRTRSKGESDSSESLDSDPDEIYESSADELSPVPTRVTEIAVQAEPVSTTERKERGGGIVVQQRLGKDFGYQFGLSKDTQDVRSQPSSLNKDAESGGNDVQKQLVRHTLSDERSVSEPAQKVRSRPGSLSLDEDMSYVSAPRFNIPSKRRQYSGSDDAEVQDKKGGFEKHRSKSEEDLRNSAGRLKMNEPSADVIVHSNRAGAKDQDISGFFQDIFGTAERQTSGASTDKLQGKYEGVGTSCIEPSADDTSLKAGDAAAQNDDRKQEVTIHEDIVSKERGIAVESSPEIPTESFTADNNALRMDSDMNELTPEGGTYDEETGRKESGVVIDSLLDQRKPVHQQLDVKSGKVESPTTDNKRNGTIENARESTVEESGDDESIQALSVLSRVKNWERKSNEDRFGASVVQNRSTIEVKVKEDYNQQGKTVGDKYQVTLLDSSGNNEEVYEDVEERQTQDISPAVNAPIEDLPSAKDDQSKPADRDHSASPEVIQTSIGLGSELQQGSYDGMGLDKSNEGEAVHDELPTEDITEETSLNFENTEMVLEQGSYENNDLDKISPGEVIHDDFSSQDLEKSEMEFQQASPEDESSNNVSAEEAMEDEFPSEDITSQASLLLEKNEMELPEESYGDANSDNVKLGKAAQDKFPSGDTTLKISLHLENSGIELQESYDDTSSDKLNSDTEVPAMSVHFEQEKTGTSPLDSEHDDAQNSEEEQGEYRDVEVRPNLDVSATNQDTSPEAGDTETIQSANEEDPTSPEGRINAMRAFSEAFVSTSLGLKGSESHEDRDTRKDQDTRVDHGYREGSGPYEDDTISMDRGTREDRGYLEDQGTREDGGYYDSQFDPQRRGYQEEEDPRDDRGYLEDQGTGEDRGYYDSQFDPQKRGYQEEEDPRDDRGYHAESEGPDSRRSSDLHYGGFHADNESMISETSGYGTPSASEDTSSKRTPSISGDEGMSTSRQEARRLPSETAPVIVTTEVDDEGDNFRNASITDYDEDLDVSFSKYESGLGNRKLKDQLSLGSRESIVSYYSNAGGEVYGKYPVSGEVLFGIKYDPKIQEFQIQIHQARGITAVDKKSNTSDPYVKTYLLPDRTRTGKRKSKVKKHTINPVFDEILTYKITYDDILQRTLWFAIWNHDSFGHNDFLGEVLVPIDQYHQSGFSLEDPEPQWYDLCERQAEDPQFSYNGEIVFSLKYVPPSALAATKKKKKKKKAGEEKGELHVNIIEASDLMAKDSNGFSDPFCKSYLLPDKSKKTKQKTAVVKKSLNPKWNYHFVYDNVTHEELMDRVLELTVWDFDRGSSNEFLGGVRLGLGTGLKEWDDSNSEEQAAWNKMLNNQNDWNQVRLTLREHMGSHKSSNGFYSDPNLVEIKPVRHPPNSLLSGTFCGSPDEQLIRHHEYHSPHESKIAAAMRLSQERATNQTPEERPRDAKTMTLAELAKSSPKGKEQSSPSSAQKSTNPQSASRSPVHSISTSPLSAPRISTPDVVTEEASPVMDNSDDSLVRHSEFYKSSTNVMRRPSSESQLSFQSPRERGGSTLSDLVKRESGDNDSLLGSNLSVNEDWRGSKQSVYSNDGVYGDHDVSGEILLSYQYFKGSFKLKIFEARGLTAVDKTQNTSNPYVKVYLLPDQSRAGKRKTRMKHATVDPEFNEEMLYKISTSDLVRRTVWVSVWHYDRFGRNDFLGEVRIPLADYQGCEVAPDWYPLLPTQSRSSDNDQGELVVALMYSPADKKRKSGQGAGKLYVKIVEAKNLPGKDADGLSDPFCKSYLLPDPQKKSKRKTPVKKRNLNPRWDYKFSYDNLTMDDLEHRVLELTLWDHDVGTSNDFLGGVRVGLGTSDASWDDCTGEEVTLWQFLLSKPNTWAQSTLPLRSEMGSRKGLRI